MNSKLSNRLQESIPGYGREWMFVFAAFLIILNGSPTTRAGGFIEVPSSIFGDVIQVSEGSAHQLFSGSLSITLSNEGDDANVVTVTTTLHQAGSSGDLSYEVAVSQRYLPDSDELANALSVAGAVNRYRVTAITVNGIAAMPLDGDEHFITTNFSERGAEYRLDIRVELPPDDMDKDRLPDWWEELYGTNPEFAGDVSEDADGDSLSNLDEFLLGTDPNQDNSAPINLTDEISIYEAGEAGLWLNVVDSDTAADAVILQFSSLTSGFSLARDGVILVAADTFTLAEMRRGALVLSHTEIAVDGGLLTLVFSETGEAVIVAVRVDRPSRQDGTDASVWLDAGHLSNSVETALAQWPDRSGNLNDATQTDAAARPIVKAVDGTTLKALSFSASDSAHMVLSEEALPGERHTTFVVYDTSNGTHPQTIFAGNRTQLTLQPLPDPNGIGYIEQFDSVNSRISGTVDIDTGALHHSTVRGGEADGRSWHNGLDSGYSESGSALEQALVPALGLRVNATGTSVTNTGVPFAGRLYELLVFPKILSLSRIDYVCDYLRGKWDDMVIWDFRDRTEPVVIELAGDPGIIRGGWSSDVLSGSVGDDVISGGWGDDVLAGRDGADRFVYGENDRGGDRITDFDSAYDILDVSSFFIDTAASIDDHIRFETDGVDTNIEVTPIADSDDNRFSITLEGIAAVTADRDRWISQGILRVGALLRIFAPVIAVNTGLDVAPGRRVTITDAVLRLTDADSPDDKLEFRITRAPRSGILRNGLNVLEVGSTFLQADLFSGQVSYTNVKVDADSDSFSFVAADESGLSSDEIGFSVTISELSGGSSDGIVVVPYSQDFEADVDGWAVADATGIVRALGPAGEHAGDWQWGSPPAEETHGPLFDNTHGSAAGKVAGTGVDAPYNDDEDSTLRSPVIQIPLNASSPSAEFAMWIDTERQWDGGSITISVNDSAFAPLSTQRLSLPYTDSAIESLDNRPGWSGDVNGQWQVVQIDLEEYRGLDIQFGFRFASDDNTIGPGWFLDDFSVTDQDSFQFPYIESFDDALAPAGWSATGDWEWGTQTIGPVADAGQLFATVIDGNYSISDTTPLTSTLTSPAVVISAYANAVTLSFSMWLDSAAAGSAADGGFLEVSFNDGATYVAVSPDSLTPAYNSNVVNPGSQPGGWAGSDFESWTNVTLDLKGLAASQGREILGSTVRVRFQFITDTDQQLSAGWTIDNFSITDDVVAFWLMADRGVRRDDDNRVREWIDHAGRFYNASQETVAQQPLRRLNGLADRTGIAFDGIDDALVLPNAPAINSAATYDEKTIGIVFRTGTDIQSRQVLYEQGNDENGFSVYLDNGQIYFGAWSISGSGAWTPAFLSAAVTPDSNYYAELCFESAGKGLGGYLNGLPLGTPIGPLGTVAKHPSAVIGAVSGTSRFHDGPAAAGFPFDGVIAEIFSHTVALPETSRNRINRYVEGRYGINGSLRVANAGLQFWLDVGEGTVTDNADGVEQWSDRSRNENNFTQSTPMQRPLVASEEVRFDGLDDLLTLDAAGGLKDTIPIAAQTVVMVFRTPNSAFSGRQVLLTQSGGGKGIQVYLETQKLHLTGWQLSADETLIETRTRHELTELGIGSRHYAVLTYNSDTGTIDIFLDGSDGSNVSTVDVGSVAADPGTPPPESSRFHNFIGMAPVGAVFHNERSTVAEFFAGSISELIYYNRILADEQRKDLEDYAAEKFNLAPYDTGSTRQRSFDTRQVLSAVYPSGRSAFNVTLRPGWNLFSVPLVADNPRVASIFAHIAFSNFYRFSEGELTTVTRVEPKIGYWGYFRVDRATTVGVTGRNVVDNTAELEPGWNLIGPVDDIVRPDDPRITGNIWAWDARTQKYEAVAARDPMRRGRGYWINAATRLEIRLGN